MILIKPLQFGAYLLVNLIVFAAIGYFLDQWLHTSPLWLIIGIMYAVIGSFILFVYRNNKKRSGK